MKQEFEMSMIGELTYFLGMQVKQTFEGIFISQAKYAKDLVKRFGLDGKSHAPTPMSTSVKISMIGSFIFSLLFFAFKIFCCTQTHTWLFKKSLFIFQPFNM
jgi:hypothetical protein